MGIDESDNLATRVSERRARCCGSEDTEFRIVGDTFGVERQIEAVGFRYDVSIHVYRARPCNMTWRQVKTAEKLRALTEKARKRRER